MNILTRETSGVNHKEKQELLNTKFKVAVASKTREKWLQRSPGLLEGPGNQLFLKLMCRVGKCPGVLLINIILFMFLKICKYIFIDTQF